MSAAPLVFGQPPTDNALYFGDCLDWMREWDSESVDLIYLDPPFNSKQDYNMLFAAEAGGDAQWRAFGDTWVWDQAAARRVDAYVGAVTKPAHRSISGLYQMLGECGMLAYLTYMAERLEECWRLLKPTGSIYLHCDPTASHYLKAVMDDLFGADNFRSEVIWKRTSSHNRAKRWAPVHDVILFYARDGFTWNRVLQPLDNEYVKRYYRYNDDRGIWQSTDLRGPGTRTGDSGQPWRGIDPTAKGRHWEPPPDRAMPDWFEFPDGYSDLSVRERLDIMDEQGMIHWPPKGSIPRFKRYLTDRAGAPVADVVTDIGPLGSHAKERLGYPTQKPTKLLERIIEASSNRGDLVLDPFCGCGTTIAAADALDRRWVGIDIDSHAVEVMLQRLGDRTIPTYGIPADYRSAVRLAETDPFGFETWAVQRAPGFAPNIRQVGDGGVDGRGTLAARPDDWPTRLALAQVKGGKRPAVDGLRAFCGVTRRKRAAVGCYITVDPIQSPQARADAWLGDIHVQGVKYDRMNLWSIHDYFDDRPPRLPPMNNPYTGKPMAQGALF